MTRITPSVRATRREAIAFQLMRFEADYDGDWPAEKVQGMLDARDARHSGDCTKQPWTCMRCMADTVYKVADAVNDAIEKADQTNG